MADGLERPAGKRNTRPKGKPFYWDPAQHDGSRSFRRQWMLDTLEFLTRLQDDLFDRYMKAMQVDDPPVVKLPIRGELRQSSALLRRLNRPNEN